MSQNKEKSLTFWDHLDELRSVLIKTVAVALVCGIVAFIFKDFLFSIVLAPKYNTFATYRWLESLGAIFGDIDEEHFDISLINTGLAQQFVIHVKTALCFGVLCASPYIIYQIFRFVSPALYSNERRYAVNVASCGYLMFMVGVLVGYMLIFPLTFRFLGTYQVNTDVPNLITLESYMSTLVLICLSMGVVFEMPVVCWFFAKLGFLSFDFMKTYRKHAIVVILIIAAIITPTSDVFTLTAVSLPMWLLYELSIHIVRRTGKKREEAQCDALQPSNL